MGRGVRTYGRRRPNLRRQQRAPLTRRRYTRGAPRTPCPRFLFQPHTPLNRSRLQDLDLDLDLVVSREV